MRGAAGQQGPWAKVFVPAKDPAEKTDWAAVLGVTAALASVLARTVAVIVAVTQ
ncbi:MAG: hypothetical protein ACRDHF_18055 [Tepidiformaceae bacterium]